MTLVGRVADVLNLDTGRVTTGEFLGQRDIDGRATAAEASVCGHTINAILLAAVIHHSDDIAACGFDRRRANSAIRDTDGRSIEGDGSTVAAMFAVAS